MAGKQRQGKTPRSSKARQQATAVKIAGVNSENGYVSKTTAIVFDPSESEKRVKPTASSAEVTPEQINVPANMEELKDDEPPILMRRSAYPMFAKRTLRAGEFLCTGEQYIKAMEAPLDHAALLQEAVDLNRKLKEMFANSIERLNDCLKTIKRSGAIFKDQAVGLNQASRELNYHYPDFDERIETLKMDGLEWANEQQLATLNDVCESRALYLTLIEDNKEKMAELNRLGKAK